MKEARAGYQKHGAGTSFPEIVAVSFDAYEHKKAFSTGRNSPNTGDRLSLPFPIKLAQDIASNSRAQHHPSYLYSQRYRSCRRANRFHHSRANPAGNKMIYVWCTVLLFLAISFVALI